MIKLRDWQEKAWEAIINSNYRSIVEASTGSGKTFLGLRLIEDTSLDKKVLVVVPTISLLNQWKSEIYNNLNLDVGLIGGGYNEEKRVTIAVINSVRALRVNYDVLIMDEIHHYSSDENVKLLKNNKFEKILGLSATVERADEKDLKEFGLDVIYRYSQQDAIINKDLCNYELINVGIELGEGEMMVYKEADNIIKELMPHFNYDMKQIFGGKWNPEKTKLRRAITKRRMIISDAKNKINKTIELIESHSNDKIIVFSEYIKTASAVRKILDSKNIVSSIYHSSIPSKEKTKMLEDFKNNDIKILLSVKALDEGLNIPDANIGIIIAGSKTARQIIQRLGRLLRAKDNIAKIYQLYVKSTKDVDWLRERLRHIHAYKKISFI